MSHQFKKKFGQNFLSNPQILQKIVDAASVTGKNILEIGPGGGALTQFIVGKAKNYLAYEIDESLKPTLNKYETQNSKIIYGDFLNEANFKFLRTYFNDEEIHLVGNLPYNVSSQIIFLFFQIPHIKSATIMLQKEVGERILAVPKTKKYNALTAITDFYTTKEKVMIVSKKSFFPQPKVDGMVVRLVKKDGVKRNIIFENFLNSVFHYKRKTIVNNLIQANEYSPKKIKEVFSKEKWSNNLRAEELTVEQLFELYEEIKN